LSIGRRIIDARIDGQIIYREMSKWINWLSGIALGLGGPGLFAIAFLDSSFVSLPQINDILVVLMVTQHKAWMLYYAL
jgi:membrane protein YqaA with SNARE-associated domain